MEINLSDEILDHFKRLKSLAEEAEEDLQEASYSSRASAMSALSRILIELTNSQEKVYNMERMMRIEKVVIETVNRHLDMDEKKLFFADLESIINAS